MNAQRWRHSPGLTQVILEKTIIKLGSLLALGFGEASVFKATVPAFEMLFENRLWNNLSMPAWFTCLSCSRKCEVTLSWWFGEWVTSTRLVLGWLECHQCDQLLECFGCSGIKACWHVHPGVHKEKTSTVEKIGAKKGGIAVLWKRNGNGICQVRDSRILGAIHRTPVLAAYRGRISWVQKLWEFWAGLCTVMFI